MSGIALDPLATQEALAEHLIATVRLGGGQLHTALLVAGTFLADPAIRERYDPEAVAAEREAEREAERAYRERLEAPHRNRSEAQLRRWTARKGEQAGGSEGGTRT